MADLSTVATEQRHGAPHHERMTHADLCKLYAAEKAAWLAANPGASSEQVEAESRAIAERLGL
jgi:hypothetical protein